MTEKEKMVQSSIKELSELLAQTDDKEFIQNFLLQLLTKPEIIAITSRWELVKLLDSGMTQRKIAEKLQISLCKITRGSRELKKENSSFRKMVEIYKENHKK